MPFSFSGGLSEMGKAISNTAGAAALEMQKSDLEQQRLQLADQLAGKREAAGREQTGIINAKAAADERDWRSTEAEKHEAAETGRAELREAGEVERAKALDARMLALHGMSEASADARADKALQFQISQAKEATKNATEKRILESAMAAGTKTIDVPYITADGEKATRPTKIMDPVAVAAKLRDTGHPDLANPFDPKPANKAPASVAPPVPTGLIGTSGLQWNPGLGQFRDSKGNLYDKSGKAIK